MIKLDLIKFYIGNIYRIFTSFLYEYEIEPSNACTIFGSRFKGGWNHIIETLKEYDLNNDIDYKETSMYNFLKKFNFQKFNNSINLRKSLPPFLFPWGAANKNLNYSNKNIMNSRFCGPSKNDFIEKEFKRTIALYNKIKIEGYQPYQFNNSFIIGTWLKKSKNNSVFLVLGGNHRMAILSHLGHEKIKVRTSKKLLRIVSLNNINSWSNVKNNKISIENAKKFFDLFFNYNGNHIKKIIYEENKK